MLRKLIGIAVMGLLAGPAGAVPILQFDSGDLVGADGVEVNGALFDVVFLEGTCVDIFSGCNEVTDFDFSSAPSPVAAAAAASNALLDQVFLDGLLGAFDSDPTTSLCDTAPCQFQTPYAFNSPTDVLAYAAVNREMEPDAAFVNDVPMDEIQSGSRFWAKWSPGAAIPEPGTALLLGMGLLALATPRKD